MVIPRNSKSKIITWLLVILIVILFYINPRQNDHFFTAEIIWDVITYYLYLPFTFLYHDPGVSRQDIIHQIWETYNIPGVFYQAYQIENGNWPPNYTLGFSMLWLPFFFVGHLWAKIGGYPLDGWSFPYQFSIANGVLIYVLLGLFFLRKVLLRFFSERMTIAVMLLVVLGTNYLHEAFNDYMQPHAVLFTGYAMLLYYTIRWHDEPKKKYAVALGLIMGIMTLARPSEILCAIIPALWGVYDKESLKNKISLLRNTLPHLMLLILCGFMVFVPQFIYWKVVTGKWLFYSYGHTEGFDFLAPHIWNVLFSFKKSWLIYTPLIIFPIIGILQLRKYNKPIFLPILLFFLLNFYLLSSWAAWWNGGSFGMRYFVESYAVLAIPFGYILMAIQKRGPILRSTFYLLMAALVFLNLFQTWQYVKWIIPEDRMTYAYYKRIFLKTSVTDEDRKLMEVQRSYESTESFNNENEYVSKTVAYLNFDDTNTGLFDEAKRDTTQKFSGQYSYLMKTDDEWGPKFQIQYDHLVPEDKDHVWLRASLMYYSEVDPKENDALIVINMPHRDYNLKYHAFQFSSQPYEMGKWNKISFDYMTPFPYSEKDHFDIYIWHRGKHNLWIDDFKVDAFERK